MELLSEAIPLLLWGMVAAVHSKPFPFEELVGLGVVLVIALGFLMLTYAEFWIQRRPWDTVVTLGVLMGIIVSTLMGIGFHLHAMGMAGVQVSFWFWAQVCSAAVALIYSAFARAAT